ncbi:Syntaxin-binding protein 5 [Mactra antiquata]
MIFYCALFCYIWCAVSAISTDIHLDFIHHNQSDLIKFLNEVNEAYPDLTQVYSIGKSGRGRNLWAIAIAGNVNANITLRPHVKYVGNMHGNEVVGRELLLHLVKYYVSEYSTNSTIQQFLNTTVVHILPTMNPDGYAVSTINCDSIRGRNNKNNVDLNRNFPNINNGVEPPLLPIQPETRLIMNWLSQYPFVLSANLHGGALVANYPFDHYNYDGAKSEYEAMCPDDDTFVFLASTYASSHSTMYIGAKCDGYRFKNGITNGADWYAVKGGMQDYNYLAHGVFELTLEIGCCKYPPASKLEDFWISNKNAMINFLMEVHRGVKGLILDKSDNSSIVGANLSIMGRESVPFKSLQNGEYYRLLMPGTSYVLKVSAKGYRPTQHIFSVVEGKVTRLDVHLEAESNSTKIFSEEIQDSSSYQITCISYLPLLVTCSVIAML